MTIELHLIADDAGNHEGFLGIFWGSTLVPFQVLLGTIGKSYFNSLRKATAADGITRVEQPVCNWVVSALGFALSMAIFVCVNVDLVLRAGWPGDLAGHARDDALAVYLITGVQIGYPVLYVVEWLALRSTALPEDEYPAALSSGKDLVIAVLDGSSKAGLAVYAAIRAWRA